jgi:hypothetical protein
LIRWTVTTAAPVVEPQLKTLLPQVNPAQELLGKVLPAGKMAIPED